MRNYLCKKKKYNNNVCETITFFQQFSLYSVLRFDGSQQYHRLLNANEMSKRSKCRDKFEMNHSSWNALCLI